MSTSPVPVSAEEPVVRAVNPPDAVASVGPIPVPERAAFGRGAERRIKQLTAKLREAERERDIARQDLKDTLLVARGLFARAKDKLSPVDQCSILDGFRQIMQEHHLG